MARAIGSTRAATVKKRLPADPTPRPGLPPWVHRPLPRAPPRQPGEGHAAARAGPSRGLRGTNPQHRVVPFYTATAVPYRSAVDTRYALRDWRNFFGADAAVANVTYEAQQRFIAYLRARGCSDGYIHRILATGRTAINRAYKFGEVSSVPYIINVRPGPARDRVLSVEEMARLFDAAEMDHLFMWLLVSCNTLARPEVACELTRFQIDFDNRLVHLNPKGRPQTKKYRPSVPLTETLLPWLRAGQSEYIVSYWGDRVRSIKRGFEAMVPARGP